MKALPRVYYRLQAKGAHKQCDTGIGKKSATMLSIEPQPRIATISTGNHFNSLHST